MPVSPEYREWVLEQLRPLGTVTGRSMFGAYSLYLDGVIFGLIDDDTVFFRTDDSNRAQFEAAGMNPFRPFGEDGSAMKYHEVPAEVLEDRDRLREWALQAADASRRGKRGKRR